MLISGLADNEIRSDSLSIVHQEKNLDKLITLIETKEIGKKSALRLNDTHRTSAVRSSYKREMNQATRNQNQNTNVKFKNTNQKNPSCNWCGNHGHGNFRDFEIRWKVCPSFNHICKTCNKKGHYETKCRDKQEKHHRQPNTSAVNTDSYDASFETEDQVGAIQQSIRRQWD